MTKAEINKGLYETIKSDNPQCDCGNRGGPHYFSCSRHDVPDYFSKEGFWDAWEWAIQQKWWVDFCYPVISEVDGASKIINELNQQFFKDNILAVPMKLTNYKTFARHLHSFLVNEGVIK